MPVAKTWNLDTSATLILDPELLLVALRLHSRLTLSDSSSLCSDLQGIPRSQGKKKKSVCVLLPGKIELHHHEPEAALF